MIQGSDLVFGFPSRRILDSFNDSESETMPRRPRLQFPGAIYHVVARGDGRRALFHDESHYARATEGLVEEVQRSAWEVLAYCWMPNHIHLLVRTPEPNLSSGMQALAE